MFCSNCGKPIRDGMKFCPYCGEKMSPENTMQAEIVNSQITVKDEYQNAQEKKPSGMSRIVSGVAAVILGIFAVVFAFKAVEGFSSCVSIVFWLDDELQMLAEGCYILLGTLIFINAAKCAIQLALRTKAEKLVLINAVTSLFSNAVLFGLGKYALENISWRGNYDFFMICYSLVSPYNQVIWPMVFVGIILVFALLLISSCA